MFSQSLVQLVLMSFINLSITVSQLIIYLVIYPFIPNSVKDTGRSEAHGGERKREGEEGEGEGR